MAEVFPAVSLEVIGDEIIEVMDKVALEGRVPFYEFNPDLLYEILDEYITSYVIKVNEDIIVDLMNKVAEKHNSPIKPEEVSEEEIKVNLVDSEI